jgi:hypothetical protein
MQNGRMMVADGSARICNEAVMAYFKVIFQHMLKLVRTTMTLPSG